MVSLKEMIELLEKSLKECSQIGDCTMKSDLWNRINSAMDLAKQLQIIVDSCNQ